MSQATADSSPVATTSPTFRLRALTEWEIGGLLLLAVIVVYSFGWIAPQILDDGHTLGPKLKRPLNAAWIMSGMRPIGILSFRVVHDWWGNENWQQRTVNIVIHSMAGIVLGLLVRDTIRGSNLAPALRERSVLIGWSVAALFLLHPLQTQAVTYICQRYESQAGMFAIIAIYAMRRGILAAGNLGWFLLSGIAAWGAFLSKEMTVALPLMMLLYDRQFLAQSWREIARARWGLYLVTMLGVGVMLYFLRLGMAAETNPSVGFAIKGLTAWEYLRSQPAILLHYLRLTFWPDIMILDYGWPVETNPFRIYGLGAIIVAFFLLSAVSWFRGSSAGLMGLMAFMILAPTSSIVPILDLAFEHRMYLVLAPLFALLVCAFVLLVDRLPWEREQRNRLLLASLTVIAVLFAIRSSLRNRDYIDVKTHYLQSLAFNPKHARVWANYGALLARQKKHVEALECYQQVAKIESEKPPYSYIAISYLHLNRLTEAREYFELSVANSEKRQPRIYYALALIQWQEFAEAEKYLRQAIAYRPEIEDERLIDAKSRLAWLLSVCPDEKIRNGTEAVQLVKDVMRMVDKPESKWHDLLAAAYAEAGDFEAAIREEETAIRIARKNKSKTESLERQLAAYQEGKPRRYVPPENSEFQEIAGEDR